MTVHEGQWADLTEVTDIYETVNSKGGLVVRGKLDRVRVTLNERGTTLSMSVPTYAAGSNAHPLSLEGTRAVFEDCASRLKLEDPGQGQVVQFAVGLNTFTKHAPEQYARLLMGSGRVDARPESKWSNVVGRTPNQDAVYNKVRDLKAKGHVVPEEWGDRHVTRFETRLLKGVTKAFGKTIYVEDLWDPSFYAAAVQRSVKRFDRLRFARAVGAVPTASVAKLDEYLYAAGIEAAGGAGRLLQLLDAVPKHDGKARTRASRVRSRIRSRATAPGAGADLGSELRNAVHAAASQSLSLYS